MKLRTFEQRKAALADKLDNEAIALITGYGFRSMRTDNGQETYVYKGAFLAISEDRKTFRLSINVNGWGMARNKIPFTVENVKHALTVVDYGHML